MTRLRPSHGALFTIALPVAWILPEVIDLGVTFVRWDHILLAIAFPIVLLTEKSRRRSTGWRYTAAGLAFAAAVVAFAAYQYALVPRDARDAGSLVKYAAAPLKTLAWALWTREVVLVLGLRPRELVRAVATVSSLVFAAQLLELASPGFRAWLFTYYPVAAQDRLLDLTFRARGPFAGYDAASVFFALSLVVILELESASADRRVFRLTMVGVSLAGAFLAARTGFLLALAYLFLRASIAASWRSRVLALVCAAAAVLVVLQGGTGADDSLLGRYAELLSGLRTGDIEEISSVRGTLYMNQELQAGGASERVWGVGLTSDTTADQLYAKYRYMLGWVGLSLWLLVHSIAVAGAWTALRTKASQAPYARAALLIGLLLAVGHWKGGNYYFAGRLGEWAMLITLLGLTARATARPDEEDLCSP